jgi:hypothetical protein
VNYATARQDDITFRKNTCLPLVNLFVDTMNSDRGYISKFNPEAKLDFSLSGLIDVEQVMKDFSPLFDRGGMTNNELRVLAGLPKSDNVALDQFWVVNNLVPIEMAGLAAEPDPLAPGGGPGAGGPVKPAAVGATAASGSKPIASKPTDAVVGGSDGVAGGEGGSRAVAA